MRYLISLLLISFLLTSCAPSPRHSVSDQNPNGIIGGSIVAENDEIALHTVKLGITILADGVKLKSGSCTAVLIAPRVLLSAAHCFDKDRADAKVNISVIFNRNSEGLDKAIRYKAAHHIIHPKYFPEKKNRQNYDIAVVLLDEDIPSSFRPVPIVSDWYGVIKLGAPVTAAGYGATSKTGSSSPVLKRLDVKIDQANKEAIYTLRSPTNSFYFGDSGGPLFIKQGGRLHLCGIAISNLAVTKDDFHGWDKSLNLFSVQDFYKPYLVNGANL
ncbi:S1 family peptidase [Bdellovibrio reynosensis]|uniref:Trypsin-like serine protease n=1 Tax=Bdellovibrio reynosensis TaxID=2835041 RepID=A0ABY4CJY2_9BACT|nr:trypsin-like serine protease [Bdellovibrio reynosensis]UOF02545.1 trypsin-like serine protease [Bdellovibrio reynosensis]